MGMTETGIIGMIALVCLAAAVIVRIWAAFAQREKVNESGCNLKAGAGIDQTTGNKELQADRAQVQRSPAGGCDCGRNREKEYRTDMRTDSSGHGDGQV